jgi:hypothetical protein
MQRALVASGSNIVFEVCKCDDWRTVGRSVGLCGPAIQDGDNKELTVSPWKGEDRKTKSPRAVLLRVDRSFQCER